MVLIIHWLFRTVHHSPLSLSLLSPVIHKQQSPSASLLLYLALFTYFSSVFSLCFYPGADTLTATTVEIRHRAIAHTSLSFSSYHTPHRAKSIRKPSPPPVSPVSPSVQSSPLLLRVSDLCVSCAAHRHPSNLQHSVKPRVLFTQTMEKVDRNTMKSISGHVDTITKMCNVDPNLSVYALKFHLEQTSDRAAFEEDEHADKLAHMLRTLKRMSDLSLAVAQNVLQRTKDLEARTIVSPTQSSSESTSPTSPHGMFHSSSVEDCAEGTEMWHANGALLSHAAVEVLAMVLIVDAGIRPQLQNYMLANKVINYLSDALAISTSHEIAFFQEGYRTDHMTLLANLTYDNKSISEAVVSDSVLLAAVLSGTKIDVENPGMVEWAKFTIRNLCEATPMAREKIRQLKAVSLDSESQKLLDGKVKYSVSPTGNVSLENV